MQTPTVAALAGAVGVSGLFLGYMMGKQKGDAPQVHDELEPKPDVRDIIGEMQEERINELGAKLHNEDSAIALLMRENASLKIEVQQGKYSIERVSAQYQRDIALLKAENQHHVNEIRELKEDKTRSDRAKAQDAAVVDWQAQLADMQRQHDRTLEEKNREIASIYDQLEKSKSLYSTSNLLTEKLSTEKRLLEDEKLALQSKESGLNDKIRTLQRDHADTLLSKNENIEDLKEQLKAYRESDEKEQKMRSDLNTKLKTLEREIDSLHEQNEKLSRENNNLRAENDPSKKKK